MVFYAKIKYFYEKEEIQEMLITAKSFEKAVKKIEQYTGDDLLEIINLEAIDSSDVITNLENDGEIKKFANYIKENAIW